MPGWWPSSCMSLMGLMHINELGCRLWFILGTLCAPKILLPATKLRQGNAFYTCVSFCSWGGLSLCLGSLSGGGFVQGFSVQEAICTVGSLSRGVSVQGVSVQEGVSVQGISVQGCLCCGGFLSRGFLSRVSPSGRVMCVRYASHWSAFLLKNHFCQCCLFLDILDISHCTPNIIFITSHFMQMSVLKNNNYLSHDINFSSQILRSLKP